MKSDKLVYITTKRLPTQKAHGYQLCAMCCAFAAQGLDVTLLHPWRRQPIPELEKTDLFTYYGLPGTFTARTLPNADTVLLKRMLPEKLFSIIHYLNTFAWSLLASLFALSGRPDILYTRDIGVCFWLSLLRKSVFLEVHDIPRRFQLKLLKLAARTGKVRYIGALTSHIKRELVDLGFSEETVHILPDCVDLELFQDLPSMNDARKRLKLPLDRPIIGYVGRFQTSGRDKGIMELVRSMAEVRRSLPPGPLPLLMCVGGPLDRIDDYMEAARESGVPEQCLLFLDRVPNTEVRYWIRACDVVTIPWPRTDFSAYCTSPLKMFEYMAAGVPMAASDLPSLRDVVRDGVNIRLVAPGNPQKLGAGIVQLLTDPELAHDLSEQALKDVRRFTWRKRADAVLKGRGLL